MQHGADVHATSKIWDITSTIYTPTTSTIGKTGIPWNNDGTYTSKQGGQNALLFAVQKHDLESARMLLDAGVDVNVAAADGTTPLLAALYKWDPLGKEFVGGKGAPAPAGSSARFGADLAMARFLLDRGAKVNVADGAGYTPLHGAALAVAQHHDTRTRPVRIRQRPGNPIANARRSALPGSRKPGWRKRWRWCNGCSMPGPTRTARPLYPTSGPVGDVRINPAPPGSSAFHIAANSDCRAAGQNAGG